MFPALEQGWNNALGQAGSVFGSARAPRQARLSSYTKNSFDTTRGLANEGVPNLDQLYATQSGILGNGGYTSQMTDAANYYKGVIDAQPGQNPYLQSMLNTNADRAANAAATRFGRGYGSNAIGSGVGNAVASANNGILAQEYENDQNRRLSAMNALGSLAQAGAGNMATWGSMSSGLNDLRYDGASRMAGIGDYIQNRNQNRYDQRANFPKQNIGWYTNILGGMGNQGSTQISRTPGPSAAQSILGGAATGGAMFGPWGAVGGGILGAFS